MSIENKIRYLENEINNILMKKDKMIVYSDNESYGLVEFCKLDTKYEYSRKMNMYDTVSSIIFGKNGYGYEVISYLESLLNDLDKGKDIF